MIQQLTRRAAAAGIVAALAALTLTSCTNDDDAAAQQAAVDYLAAADAGDHERYCDLSVEGHENRAKCLDYSHIANDVPGFSGPPKAVHVQRWDDGKAVVVEVPLRAANGQPRYKVLGLVEQDGNWLVKRSGSYLDSTPDDATVSQELT